MPNQRSLRQEDLCESYVRALCAVNGYSITKEIPDNDGVDVTIKCKERPDSICARRSPKLDVQLKSCYSNHIQLQEDGSILYDLEVKNYKQLIEADRMIPFILVVLHMHENEGLWLEHTLDYLKITKCAYWISLKGREDTDNTETIRIQIPAANVLSDQTLKDIMTKVANNQEL